MPKKVEIPEGLDAGLIGKVVSIQVFEKNSLEEGLIKRHTMEKFVGTLRGYTWKKDRLELLLDHGIRATVQSYHYIEIYPYDDTRVIHQVVRPVGALGGI